MTPERNRMWTIFDDWSTRGAIAGAVVVPNLTATSGHRLDLTMRSAHYARLIADIDPKLEEPAFVQSLY